MKRRGLVWLSCILGFSCASSFARDAAAVDCSQRAAWDAGQAAALRDCLRDAARVAATPSCLGGRCEAMCRADDRDRRAKMEADFASCGASGGRGGSAEQITDALGAVAKPILEAYKQQQDRKDAQDARDRADAAENERREEARAEAREERDAREQERLAEEKRVRRLAQQAAFKAAFDDILDVPDPLPGSPAAQALLARDPELLKVMRPLLYQQLTSCTDEPAFKETGGGKQGGWVQSVGNPGSNVTISFEYETGLTMPCKRWVLKGPIVLWARNDSATWKHVDFGWSIKFEPNGPSSRRDLSAPQMARCDVPPHSTVACDALDRNGTDMAWPSIDLVPLGVTVSATTAKPPVSAATAKPPVSATTAGAGHRD